MPVMPRILLCDDQSDILKALRLVLKGEGWGAELAPGPREALALVGKAEFDAALIDMNYTRDTTSGLEGLDLLSALLEAQPGLPVVVMTAWGSIGLAVEAMRRGARDFIEKPWENHRLVSVLRNQLALGQAQRATQRLAEENRLLRGGTGNDLIAVSPAMQRVAEMIARMGDAQVNVLITGENGAGKGMVARALHAASVRGGKPLITVNLGGLAAGVFESELFGHVRGAFTGANEERIGRFELADGGTLFLDEIGNITPAMQAALLRVLETGEMERVGSSRTRKVDVRIISATNALLEESMVQGAFRRDLFYRLNTVEIAVPPLRERREDILPLAEHFLVRHARHYARPAHSIAASARVALLAHGWPGNVRELDHAIERAVLFARGDEISANDLLLGTGSGAAATLDDLSLEDVERVLIQKALAKNGGNVSQAAQALGLSRSALYRRLEKYGI
jgi:DNA-binding NtrC family response regulator